MADLKTISVAVTRVLDRMSGYGQKLPSNWDEGEFCLDAAISLARLVEQLDWRVCADTRETMERIGGILLRSVYHQLEAGNLADTLMDDLRGGRS